MKTTDFVDIHCHLLPGIDDGAKSWDESLTMAKMAAADGIRTMIMTPHQLGNYAHNEGDMIRAKAKQFQQLLDSHDVPLTIMPGADVRIEPQMIRLLKSGNVLSLGDHRKHVLLELPHELYFPLDGVLEGLQANNMVGILSHPERNQGILKQPDLIPPLVERGCLMQITANSLTGVFGKNCQALCEWLLERQLVHFVATDAHGPRSRRPLIRRAFDRVEELSGTALATELCCTNPLAVAEGRDIQVRPPKPEQRSLFASLFRRRAA